MTWADYNRLAYGYIKKETKEWEHTRAIISMIYNSNVSKRHHQKDPQKIIPLWTDKLGKTKKEPKMPISKEEFNQVVEKLDSKNG